MSREIQLTKGLFAIVDDEDYERLNKHKWYANKINDIWYAVRNTRKNGKRMKVLMHREVLRITSTMEVDHIDHNGLNNHSNNLRKASHAQNSRNKRPRKKTSRFKGVSWHKDRRKWRATIKVNYRSITIGCYTKEIEAALAYDESAKTYFGEFACVNMS